MQSPLTEVEKGFSIHFFRKLFTNEREHKDIVIAMESIAPQKINTDAICETLICGSPFHS